MLDVSRGSVSKFIRRGSPPLSLEGHLSVARFLRLFLREIKEVKGGKGLPLCLLLCSGESRSARRGKGAVIKKCLLACARGANGRPVGGGAAGPGVRGSARRVPGSPGRSVRMPATMSKKEMTNTRDMKEVSASMRRVFLGLGVSPDTPYTLKEVRGRKAPIQKRAVARSTVLQTAASAA